MTAPTLTRLLAACAELAAQPEAPDADAPAEVRAEVIADMALDLHADGLDAEDVDRLRAPLINLLAVAFLLEVSP